MVVEVDIVGVTELVGVMVQEGDRDFDAVGVNVTALDEVLVEDMVAVGDFVEMKLRDGVFPLGLSDAVER